MKIVKYPHPALRVQARPVTAIDKEVQMAAGQMLDLMYTHEGLGLAAPQVALDIQLLNRHLQALLQGLLRRRAALELALQVADGAFVDAEAGFDVAGVVERGAAADNRQNHR